MEHLCALQLDTTLATLFTTSPISGIVRHHGKEIEQNETLAKLLTEPPVVAFRRPKTIKDTLVRAAVSKPLSTVGQCKPCGEKSCKCCIQLQSAQVFHSKTTRKEYKIFCNVKWYTFWIYQRHPMRAPATESVDSRASASFS
jgi:hypothetical protein